MVNLAGRISQNEKEYKIKTCFKSRFGTQAKLETETNRLIVVEYIRGRVSK
jgi:hypothetical protein